MWPQNPPLAIIYTEYLCSLYKKGQVYQYIYQSIQLCQKLQDSGLGARDCQACMKVHDNVYCSMQPLSRPITYTQTNDKFVLLFPHLSSSLGNIKHDIPGHFLCELMQFKAEQNWQPLLLDILTSNTEPNALHASH